MNKDRQHTSEKREIEKKQWQQPILISLNIQSTTSGGGTIDDAFGPAPS